MNAGKPYQSAIELIGRSAVAGLLEVMGGNEAVTKLGATV